MADAGPTVCDIFRTSHRFVAVSVLLSLLLLHLSQTQVQYFYIFQRLTISLVNTEKKIERLLYNSFSFTELGL